MATEQRRSKAASKCKTPAKPHEPVKAEQDAQQPAAGPSSNKGSDGLTDQQRQFYRAYKIHHNGTKAAIEAGYSPATAMTQASRLLRHAKIRALLEQDEHEAKAAYEHDVAQAVADFDITPGRILREIARVAFFDARKTAGKQLVELDDDTAAAIAGMDVQHLYGGSGEDRGTIGEIRKWKFADKLKALDMLAKHRNLYAADNDGKAQPFAEALAAFIGSMHSQGGSKLPIRPAAART